MKIRIIIVLMVLLTGLSSVSLSNADSKNSNHETEAGLPFKAPAWSLLAIANESGRFSNEAYQGKITYLDFWASWCGPCRLSLPALNDLSKEFQGHAVQFLAITVDVVEEDAWDFLKRYKVDYPVFIDPEGHTARSFGVNGMPSGYLIDEVGNVHEIHIGYQRGDEDRVRKGIYRLLSQGKTS